MAEPAIFRTRFLAKIVPADVEGGYCRAITRTRFLFRRGEAGLALETVSSRSM
jgi:hypothetical protein